MLILAYAPAKNFSQLIALRALQGIAECCISPGMYPIPIMSIILTLGVRSLGFVLVIGSWYKTREHPSRALFFQVNTYFGYRTLRYLSLTEVCNCRVRMPALESSAHSFSTVLGLETRATNPGAGCPT